MIRVGIVAEGSSDWLVLEEVMKVIHPEIEFVRLRPDITLVSGSPFGWKGVRAWCRDNGPMLEVLMTGVLGKPLHLLVIHLDCSMAHNEGAAYPCPPASDTAQALRTVILSAWLGRVPKPFFVVLATPSKSIEAWVAATLDPPHANLANIECNMRVEDELVQRKLLRRKDGEVKKQAKKFLPLAVRVGDQLASVSHHCPEAATFRREFTFALIWNLWTGCAR